MGKVSIGIVAGAQILTSKGEQNIEYIEKGDLVLGHMGRFQEVLSNASRIFRGEVLYIDVLHHPSLKCDGDTLLYSQDDEGNRIWKEARDIRPKDLLCIEGIDNDVATGEWVKVRSVTRMGGSCRYLYGLDVAEDKSFTANGYIVNGEK